MRFIIMHKTAAHWEAGAVPSPELIARDGTMLGELREAGVLHDAAGLRASSAGARVRFVDGRRTINKGPFVRGNELPAGFTIVRASSLEDAIEWATRQAAVLGDCEVDIRPVTEPWDIGMAPEPTVVTARRYMILRKATAASEAGASPSAAQRIQLSRLIEESARTNTHLLTENMRPSARGRRYKNSHAGISVFDGPFVESKELIGGYITVSAESIDDAERWARRYVDAVDADEVDMRELE
jgi:hypothetical protein